MQAPKYGTSTKLRLLDSISKKQKTAGKKPQSAGNGLGDLWESEAVRTAIMASTMDGGDEGRDGGHEEGTSGGAGQQEDAAKGGGKAKAQLGGKAPLLVVDEHNGKKKDREGEIGEKGGGRESF